MKQITSVLSTVAAVAAIAFGGAFFAAAPASVAAGDSCVPAEAWTETIEHPAVTHEETVVVVDEEAWTETIPATPDLWWNWSPNHNQGPFEGPPDFPTDPRGTWQGPHENGGPSQGTYGTFQQGNGNGSWFHREQGDPEQVIEHPAVTHEEIIVVVDEEAWTETIEHEAVVCDPEDPKDPKDPKDPEEPSEPVRDRETKCLGGALVTEVFVDGQRVSSSTENGHPNCAQRSEDGEPFQEEGM